MKYHKVNKKNLGLIIQGPIYSKSTTQKLNRKKFDTNKNIEKILTSFSFLFKEIVLATWLSEKSKISKKLINNKKLKIIFLKDPGHNPGNEYRHYYSSYFGTKKLSRDIKFTMKVRSDQFLDLNKIINFYNKETVRKQHIKSLTTIKVQPICTFGYWLERPYAIADFFYLGSKSDLLSFFKAQIKYKKYDFLIKENILWPEGGALRKYVYFNKKNFKKFQDREFFPMIYESFSMYQYKLPSVIVSKKNLIFWQYLIKNIFTVLPDNIRKNMYWRGAKFNPIDKQSSYGSWKKAEINYLKELEKTDTLKVKKKFFFNLPNFLLFSYYKKNHLKMRYFKIFYIFHLLYFQINFACYCYLRLRNYIFKKLI
jgi:hypothetical protein